MLKNRLYSKFPVNFLCAHAQTISASFVTDRDTKYDIFTVSPLCQLICGIFSLQCASLYYCSSVQTPWSLKPYFDEKACTIYTHVRGKQCLGRGGHEFELKLGTKLYEKFTLMVHAQANRMTTYVLSLVKLCKDAFAIA